MSQQQKWVEPEKTTYPLPKVRSHKEWLEDLKRAKERMKGPAREVYNLLLEGQRRNYI